MDKDIDLIQEFDGAYISPYPSIPKPASSQHQTLAEDTSASYPSLVSGPKSRGVSTSASKQSEQSPALPPRHSTRAPTPNQTIDNTARRWKDVLVRAGVSVEYAWKYGLEMSQARFNESNALQVTHEDLKRIGVNDQEQRQSILDTIQQIAQQEYGYQPSEQEHNNHAFMTWRNLMIRADLGKAWGALQVAKYAQLLAQEGWDDWNAEDLDESLLESMGVEDPNHREVLLELIQRELDEAELHPGTTQITPLLTQEERQLMEQAAVQSKQILEQFEVFQQRLAAVLRGDTETQRQARAKRAAQRAIRDAERANRRREKEHDRMGM